MFYRLDLGPWNQIFPVPCALVDSHIKLAAKEHLQVILWLLRQGGQPFSPETTAQALDISTDAVLDALEYWTAQGLLTAAAEGELRPAPQPALPPVPAETRQSSPSPALPQPSPPAPAPAEQKPAQPEASALPPKKRMLRPDGEHVAARATESQAMRFLLQEAENVLGKTLSPAMTALLVSIIDDYGLPVDVTMMLIHYAADVGRASASYIDAVAREWAESGVLSVAAAEERLQMLSKVRLAWGKVSSAAGLPRRAPSKSEAERAHRWVDEWHFSSEMLTAAYDLCAEHTGKFSAAYMDRVLTGWHEKGIQNLDELAEHRRAAQEKNEQQSQSRSYDIDALAQMSTLDLPDEL